MAYQREDILSSITDTRVSELKEDRLPTNLEVLQALLHKLKNNKSTVDVSSKILAVQIKNIWCQTGINTKRLDHCIIQLKNIYYDFRSVQKFQNKSSFKVNDFIDKLSKVFDISQECSISDSEKKILFSVF